MYLLYLSQLCLFLLAIALLSIVYLKNAKSFTFAHFFGITLLIGFFSFGIYYIGSRPQHLQQWLKYGKKQYEFLIQYERLGGINGMINRIQHKLDENPSDLEAWIILGKLYIAKTDYMAAKDAFTHAHTLEPHNSEVNHYLDIATHPAQYALL